MSFKRTIVLALIVALAASAAMAGTPKTDGRTDIETFQQMNRIHGDAFTSRAVFQGFEGGVIPAGWTQTIVNPARTWSVSNATSVGSLEGAYCAYVGYDLTVYQNETISFSQPVNVAGGESVLSFWMAGALGTSWDLNVAETVEVNGIPVFDFDSNVTAHMTYEQFFVDLGAYDGTTVTITFRYQGVDGDLHVLDAVMVDDGTGYSPPPPPPPPANDTCATAIDLQAQGLTSFQVDLCLANGDYSAPSGGCTGYTSAGNDVVYKIYLAAGESFIATETGEHDSALWLVTDCANTAGTCVAGADDTFGGDTEVLSYAAASAGWYYLIVDAYGTGACSLTTVTIEAPVSNEDLSWGNLKTMYR
ncbi:MAG: choice-of-anchor J domain-containing protein [bacterium]|nr:choice-of-anchor J domain-containing protein [bacterium]